MCAKLASRKTDDKYCKTNIIVPDLILPTFPVQKSLLFLWSFADYSEHQPSAFFYCIALNALSSTLSSTIVIMCTCGGVT